MGSSAAQDAAKALVRELAAGLDEAPSVPTTIRLSGRMFKRLKKQHQRWGTSMSLIIERALDPMLEELEKARTPAEGGFEDLDEPKLESPAGNSGPEPNNDD